MVTKPNRIRGAFLAALCAVACSFPEDPIAPREKRLVIHAILNPGTSIQSVAVGYTHGAITHPSQEYLLKNATVTITTPDGIVMTATQDSTFLYRVRPSAYGVTLQPGATYTLNVHTVSNEDATGTTTIPSALPVSLTPPLEFFRRLRDSLHLTWAAIDGAQSYELRILTEYGSGQFTNTDLSHPKFVEPGLTLPGTANDPLEGEDYFTTNTKATVLISAVDRNYYEYYRLLADPFAGSAASRLTGAVGVFGSMVPIVARRLDVR